MENINRQNKSLIDKLYVSKWHNLQNYADVIIETVTFEKLIFIMLQNRMY